MNWSDLEPGDVLFTHHDELIPELSSMFLVFESTVVTTSSSWGTIHIVRTLCLSDGLINAWQVGGLLSTHYSVLRGSTTFESSP